ncbi:MAG: hypothetical protein BWY88_00519 [Synergistetes bacterium ADurb.Bin520]|nr:MAG: hypothetical protein BWY88_00519 [Synergistetes bacterium ADurb.Bin520]
MMPSEVEFAWTAQPMPKDARKAKRAKSHASHFMLAPFSRMYMVPPRQAPAASFSRKCTARETSQNLVVMPKKAEMNIHTRAPGPPRCMAVATPAMFPVPTVAERAVARAAKEEMEPSPSLFLPSLPRTSLNMKPK